MDHHHPSHHNGRAGRPATFAIKVDPRLKPRLECEIAVAQAVGKDRRDMSIGHEETVADDETGASVGILRIAGKLEATDRGDGSFDPASNYQIRRQVSPQFVGYVELSVDDVDGGPKLRYDEGLE